MKIYISYFYMIRFFSPNIIPISTAKWNPKWFSKNGHMYLDDNKVINGITFSELSPGDQLSGLCHGKESCELNPESCNFLEGYRSQINKLSIDDLLLKLNKLMDLVRKNFKYGSNEELIPAFIVYESPDNPCSERSILMNWFKIHGLDCSEFTK